MNMLDRYAEELLTSAHNLVHEMRLLNEQQEFGITTIFHHAILVAEILTHTTLSNIKQDQDLRHRINNMLTPMLGYTHLLMSGKLGQMPTSYGEELQSILCTIRKLNEMLQSQVHQQHTPLPAFT
jgi:hypothetical protein